VTAVDYFHRAQQHRPTDTETLRAAAVELAQRGLTPRDIGAALRLDPTAVRRLLGEVRP
jgi:Flp pilus assembly protein TadD